jgi:hypothetical protein
MTMISRPMLSGLLGCGEMLRDALREFDSRRVAKIVGECGLPMGDMLRAAMGLTYPE